MAHIVSVHSFRGGTGKSNTVANLATILALDGKRVGVVDTDMQSPGIHVLFGLAGGQITNTLNDYMWGKSTISQIAHEVSAQVSEKIPGKIYLIPSSMKPGEITRVLREGYNAQYLIQGLKGLIQELQLDVLLIDTHPGLGEETLLSIVISHTLVILLRPDQQDYEGTGITLQVANKLQVPNMVIIVNKVPAIFNPAEVQQHVEQTYHCPVVAVLPHSEEMMTLASGGVFSIYYPNHLMTSLYQQAISRIMEF
jgi:MinD-like ATPase involved in chromosome partitioning or flagellar assembly